MKVIEKNSDDGETIDIDYEIDENEIDEFESEFKCSIFCKFMAYVKKSNYRIIKNYYKFKEPPFIKLFRIFLKTESNKIEKKILLKIKEIEKKRLLKIEKIEKKRLLKIEKIDQHRKKLFFDDKYICKDYYLLTEQVQFDKFDKGVTIYNNKNYCIIKSIFDVFYWTMKGGDGWLQGVKINKIEKTEDIEQKIFHGEIILNNNLYGFLGTIDVTINSSALREFWFKNAMVND